MKSKIPRIEEIPELVSGLRGNMSYREAEEAWGIDHSTICRMEKGGVPTLQTMEKLMKVMEVESDDSKKE